MKKELNYISDVINLRKDDVILAAHPKTGSTWIRFLFCNLNFLKERKEVAVDFNLLNNTFVAFGEGKLKNAWACPSSSVNSHSYKIFTYL